MVVHLEETTRGEPAGFGVCSYRARFVLTSELGEVTCRRCKKTAAYKA